MQSISTHPQYPDPVFGVLILKYSMTQPGTHPLDMENNNIPIGKAAEN